MYFDNVGGDQLEAALARMRNCTAGSRSAALSSQYNDVEPPTGPRNFLSLLVNRVNVRGFIVLDHFGLMGEFLKEVGGYVASGEIKYRETVVEGIENMPDAFIGLFSGENTGKMLVRVGPDPA